MRAVICATAYITQRRGPFGLSMSANAQTLPGLDTYAATPHELAVLDNARPAAIVSTAAVIRRFARGDIVALLLDEATGNRRDELPGRRVGLQPKGL